MTLDIEFQRLLLSKIKDNHNNLLILRNVLLKYKSMGMDKNSMLRNLEELRNDNDEEIDDIVLELMDFVVGFCNQDLAVFRE